MAQLTVPYGWVWTVSCLVRMIVLGLDPVDRGFLIQFVGSFELFNKDDGVLDCLHDASCRSFK